MNKKRNSLQDYLGSPEEHKSIYLTDRKEAFFQDADFTDYIQEKMKSHRPRMTNKDIAKKLGYTGEEVEKKADHIKKIIGTRTRKYTNDRNKIIAICKAIDLSTDETDHALGLYKMLPIDQDDIRESVIAYALDYKIDLEELNDYLRSSNCQVLSLEKQPEPKYTFNKYTSPYKITSEKALAGNFFYGINLKDNYNPGAYDCEVYLEFEDVKHHKYLLEYRGPYGLNLQETIEDGSQRSIVTEFQTPSEALKDEYRDPLVRANILLKRKYNEVFTYLDDTKYFNTRYYAELVGDEVMLYAETFSFDNPFFSEYFQMKTVNGNCVMTVSNDSYFLQNSIKDEYTKYYSYKKEEVYIAEYFDYDLIWDKRHKEAYKKLKSTIDQVKADLRNGSIVLYSVNDMLNEYYLDMAEIFGIKNLFNWSDEENMHFIPDKTEFKVMYGEKEVCMSFDILEKALSLGINSLEEVCYLLVTYGSVYAVIK